MPDLGGLPADPAAARRRGEEVGAAYRLDQASFPAPTMRESFGGSGRATLLSRALAALRVPTWALTAVAPLLPTHARETWHWFLSRHAYWHGVRRGAGPDLFRRIATETPILMYHAFGGAQSATRFVVPASQFERQLVLLRLLRRRPMTVSAYADARRARRPLPRRAVVITIDDGFADAATVAAPLLRRYKIPATLFVVAARAGGADDWDDASHELHGRPLLGWDALAALPGELEVGAHTRTHPRLPELDEQGRRDEIEGSRREIVERLGRDVTAFSYPYGATEPGLERVVQTAGFSCACGVADGLNTVAVPLYALRRAEVYGGDSSIAFVRKLVTGRSGRYGQA